MRSKIDKWTIQIKGKEMCIYINIIGCSCSCSCCCYCKYSKRDKFENFCKMTVRIRCFNVTVPVSRSGASRKLSFIPVTQVMSVDRKMADHENLGAQLVFPTMWGMWNTRGRPESCTCFHSAHHSDVDAMWGIICWFFVNTHFPSRRWDHSLFSAWLRVYAELALRRVGYPIKGSDTTGTDTLSPSKADDCQIVNQNIQRRSFPTSTRIQSLSPFIFCVTISLQKILI